jgi:RNA:NAD 2'-phosphotransferase (TPT1/KptA family)
MARDRCVHHSTILSISSDLTRSSAAVAEKEGLKVMTRNHIHCAIGLAGESGVISGTSCPL